VRGGGADHFVLTPLLFHPNFGGVPVGPDLYRNFHEFLR